MTSVSLESSGVTDVLMGSTGAGESSAATESEAGTGVGIGDTESVVFA